MSAIKGGYFAQRLSPGAVAALFLAVCAPVRVAWALGTWYGRRHRWVLVASGLLAAVAAALFFARADARPQVWWSRRTHAWLFAAAAVAAAVGLWAPCAAWLPGALLLVDVMYGVGAFLYVR